MLFFFFFPFFVVAERRESVEGGYAPTQDYTPSNKERKESCVHLQKVKWSDMKQKL